MGDYTYSSDGVGVFTPGELLHIDNEDFNPSPILLIVQNKVRENDVTLEIYVKRVDLTGYDSDGNPTYSNPYYSHITKVIPAFTDFDTTYYLEMDNVVEVLSIVGSNGKKGDSFAIYGLGDTNIKIMWATNKDRVRDAIYRAFDQRFCGFKMCSYCFGTGTDPDGNTCSTCNGTGQTNELSAKRYGLDLLSTDAGIVRWESQKYDSNDTESDKDAKDRSFRHRVHGQRMWIVPRKPDIQSVFAKFLDKNPEDIIIYENEGYTHDAPIIDYEAIHKFKNYTIPSTYYNYVNTERYHDSNEDRYFIRPVKAYSECLWNLSQAGWTSYQGSRSSDWATVGTPDSMYSWLLSSGQSMTRTDNYSYIKNVKFDAKTKFMCSPSQLSVSAGTESLKIALSPETVDYGNLDEPILIKNITQIHIEPQKAEIQKKEFGVIIRPRGSTLGNHCGSRSYPFYCDYGYAFVYENGNILHQLHSSGVCWSDDIKRVLIDKDNDATCFGVNPHSAAHFDFQLNDDVISEDYPGHDPKYIRNYWDLKKIYRHEVLPLNLLRITVRFKYKGGSCVVKVSPYGSTPSSAEYVTETPNKSEWEEFEISLFIFPSQTTFQLWFLPSSDYWETRIKDVRIEYQAIIYHESGSYLYEYDISNRTTQFTPPSPHTAGAGELKNVYVDNIKVYINNFGTNIENSVSYTITTYDEDGNASTQTQTFNWIIGEKTISIQKFVTKIQILVELSTTNIGESPSVNYEYIKIYKIDNMEFRNVTLDTSDITGNQQLTISLSGNQCYIDNLVLNGYKMGWVETNVYEFSSTVVSILMTSILGYLTAGKDEHMKFYYKIGESAYECENTEWVGPFTDIVSDPESSSLLFMDIQASSGHRFMKWKVELYPTKDSYPILYEVPIQVKYVSEDSSPIQGYQRVPYAPIWTISLPTTYGKNYWWKYYSNAKELIELAESIVPAGTVVRVEHYLPAPGSAPNYDVVEKLKISDKIYTFDLFADSFESYDINDTLNYPWYYGCFGGGSCIIKIVGSPTFDGNRSLKMSGWGAAAVTFDDAEGSWEAVFLVYLYYVNSYSHCGLDVIGQSTYFGDSEDIVTSAVWLLTRSGKRAIQWFHNNTSTIDDSKDWWEYNHWYLIRVRGNSNTHKWYFRIEDAENNYELIYEKTDIDYYQNWNSIKVIAIISDTDIDHGDNSIFIDKVEFRYLSD